MLSDEQIDGQPDEYGLVQSFFIDTDAYSNRDRNMFVAGFEFDHVLDLVDRGWHGERPIHRENESRLRMALGRRKVSFTIAPHDGYEGCETWSQLIVHGRQGGE